MLIRSITDRTYPGWWCQDTGGRAAGQYGVNSSHQSCDGGAVAKRLWPRDCSMVCAVV